MSVKTMQFGPDHPWYDDSRAPIILLAIPERPSDEDLHAAFAAAQKWLQRQVDSPFGFIVDLRHVMSFTASQRRLMADVEKTYQHVDRAYNVGQAVIVENALTRGVATAVYWMSPPVYPVRVVPSLETALEWLEHQMVDALAQFPDGPLWTERKAVARLA